MRQRTFTLLKHLGEDISVELLGLAQPEMHPDASAIRQADLALRQYVTMLTPVGLPRGRWRKKVLAVKALTSGRSYNEIWLQSSRYRDAVREAITIDPPDIVHFDTISLAPYLSEIPSDLPCVLTHHNVESDMLFRRADRNFSRIGRAFFRTEARRLLKYETSVSPRFARHIVCSPLDADRLSTIVPSEKISVVPNGVDTEYFHPSRDTPIEPGTLVFVGGLSWYPNASAMQFFVRDVWPQLRTRRTDIRFTIVGKHPPTWLQHAASQDPRLSVTGFVPDMRPLVHRSAVYVCPIYDGGGTKVKMLDALALGKAIVAHPVACEGLGLRDGHDVLVATSPDEFCNSIFRLLEDDALRSRLGENARAKAEQEFSGTVVASHLRAAYMHALAHAPTR